ncbi:MAG: metal ABC transporter substrate-binding protein [Bacillota bacterium]
MRTLVLILVMVLCVLPGGCAGSKSDRSSGKVEVAATFFPLYDFARQIGGERVHVTCLVPPGVSVHDWEPTPGDVARMMRADVLVYNGAELEPWVNRILPEFKGKRIVEATRGLELLRFDTEGNHRHGTKHHQSPYDPHAWLDPVNAQHYAAQIAEGLAEADPAGAAYYRKQLAAYTSELQALDGAYREAAARFKHREFVTAHAAFGYLAARYGLRQIPVAGLSPQAEPSPARLKELVQLVKEHGIRYVFFESAANPRLAQALAQEAGVDSLVLDPVAGFSQEEKAGEKDYIEVMEENLRVLQTALE